MPVTSDVRSRSTAVCKVAARSLQMRAPGEVPTGVLRPSAVRISSGKTEPKECTTSSSEESARPASRYPPLCGSYSHQVSA